MANGNSTSKARFDALCECECEAKANVFVAVAVVTTPNRTSQSVFRAKQHTVIVFVNQSGISVPVLLGLSLFWADPNFFWAEIYLKYVKMETNLKLTSTIEKLFYDVLRLFWRPL